MNSIFDLPQSVDELAPLNDGMTRVGYDQVSCTRENTKGFFAGGTQHYKFTTGSTKWWIPNRSYFRMRLAIANGAADAQLTADSDVAPNMNICANLFQSAELRLQGKTISRIDDFLPQVDSLETRLSKSKSWLDGQGASTGLWQTSVQERQTVVDSDGIINETVSSSSRVVSSDPLNTVVGTAVGLFTFAAGGGTAIPDLTTLYNQGDEAVLVVGGTTITFKVKAVTATTLTSTSAQPVLALGVITSLTRNRSTSVNSARGVRYIELIWTPPLSLMKYGGGLPTGEWEIVLTPHSSSSYPTYAVESLDAHRTSGTHFSIEVESLLFYCAVVEGARFENGTYALDLDETSCQVNNITTTSFGQKDFTVSPSTYALTIAYQDARVGTDTRCSSSKFKSQNDGLTASTELQLQRMFVNFNSQNFPQPDADPNFDATKDYTTQRYLESQIMSGCYFDTGGCESIQEYHERGAYYHFKTPQDKGTRATRVIVNQGFIGDNDDTKNMRVLLFSHHKSVLQVSIANGQVRNVSVEPM